MKKISFLLPIFLTAGCSSEVDKCVNSSILAWEAKQDRLKQELIEKEEKPKNFFDQFDQNTIYIDKRSRQEVEAAERLKCMKAMSSK